MWISKGDTDVNRSNLDVSGPYDLFVGIRDSQKKMSEMSPYLFVGSERGN